ncbi:mitochondrial solute carrier family 25 (mitochondrial folate transporter) member 32 [Andalucia godoyi]|uniref:Mitochondrial solute carrier family 25 (Mitochondrial folate transporter) member 32 n=1 Tax=Andalucia godoyi TaxID=505711 RepID=A0A8K0AJ77_ANDGO|nr:mitochondrial solute carrier family 25 (mitochondrial folate transporter) member 32 [Andalucia godoyi]|eukprot:ANDGO_00079.mRNA.1 mitochondrial solute carrier family 25 (mitochondrial folate transporter) member 32
MGDNAPKKQNSVLAGFLAGAIPTVTLHPLDFIKVRFQAVNSQEIRALGTFGAASNIAKTQGIRTLFSGLVPSLIGNSASWGIYLYLYSRIKSWNAAHISNPLIVSFSSGVQAGVCSTLMTNPIWLIKTRLQLQNKTNHRYSGMTHAFKTIVREEGVAGLYRGIVPALFLVSHGSLQFMAYDELKRLFDADSHLSYFAAGVASKTFAMVITYPFQVVKTRLQDFRSTSDHSYRGFRDAVQQIIRKEGPLTFYRGLSASFYRLVPMSAMTLTLYEFFSQHLP